jgi:hypothetical protein
MFISIGFGTYIFFACFSLLAAIFSFFFVPDTSQRTLEAMDLAFRDNLGSTEAAIKADPVARTKSSPSEA